VLEDIDELFNVMVTAARINPSFSASATGSSPPCAGGMPRITSIRWLTYSGSILQPGT